MKLFILQLIIKKELIFFQKINPFNSQPHKMVKPTQTILLATTDELFECVRPFCEVGAFFGEDSNLCLFFIICCLILVLLTVVLFRIENEYKNK